MTIDSIIFQQSAGNLKTSYVVVTKMGNICETYSIISK